jgi:hypothetical protein
MKLSEKLANFSELLANPDENAFILEADEYGEEVLDKVSEAFVAASKLIKEASDYLNPFEPYSLSVGCFGPVQMQFSIAASSASLLKDKLSKKLEEIGEQCVGCKCNYSLTVDHGGDDQTTYSGSNLDIDKLEKEVLSWLSEVQEQNEEKKPEVSEEDLEEDLEGEFATSVDGLSAVASFANELDKSNDPVLQKYASVLDELLITLAATQEEVNRLKMQQDNKTEELKKKYQNIKTELDNKLKSKEAVEAIKKSPYFKEYRPMEAPLSTRYSPDHPGVQVARVGEGLWQDGLTGKVYDYQAGFTTERGVKVPGGSVSGQTDLDLKDQHVIFDNREGRVNEKADKK